MKIGFIGTGDITVALVTGLCTAKQFTNSIWVSPRNKEKSKLLKEQFSQVAVGKSNQDVVDNTDVVLLAFLPKDRSLVLESLVFRDDQTIINLLGGTPISHVAALVNEQCEISRAVPLPYAEVHVGPIVVYPDNKKADQIFNALGTVISVENEEQLEYLSVITALMASYFEMLGCITDWATQSGIKQKPAADYIASMYEALSVLAQKSPTGDFHKLADESMTPGGLNELARKIINQSGGYEYLNPALQEVTDRVVGKD